ncbi:MAG TPA: substrate-binding domain-containing protein [Micromonosporaceae bacterium]|nr:substrate-binding domain-containing protein [Micromonosporaceae bacterium]
MTNDLSPRVPSHRLGGPRRRRPLRAGLIVIVVLAGLLTAGFTYLAKRGCSGRDTAVVAVSPDIAPLFNQLDASWSKTNPSVGGHCVAVTVVSRDSALMATQLAGPWDAADNGPPPNVWVPSSTVWAQYASTSAVVAKMVPKRQPSVASSPSVLAMPKDMAAALGWPNKVTFDWSDIATASADPNYWQTHGQSYGRFVFSMTDPKTSTAGLLALMSTADANNDGTVSASERADVVALKESMHRYVGDTSDVTTQLAKADRTSTAAVLAYGAAFPALERDVVAYDATKPREPLVAMYPSSGSYDANYPYLSLANPPWGTDAALAAATAFESYVLGPNGRSLFLANGYRVAGHGGPQLTNANGALAKVPSPLRTAPAPDSVADTLNTWTAITRQTNLLLVLDISGSMAEVVSGKQTRMDLAKAAAVAAVRQFDPKSSVGLWVFSTALNGTQDYKSLVSVGTLSDSMPDGQTRRQDMIDAIENITPGGDTGLYDTIAAAQAEMTAHYQQFATNLVVLLTDGKNDDTTGGLSLADLERKLNAARSSAKNVPVVTIGFGADADFATLAQISHASGTISLSSQDGVDIDKVLLAGIFGAPTTPGP